jgi:predicted nucleic acid-binding protein
MAVVVDASAVGAIAFGEPEGPALAAHLEGETLLAPTLLDYELVNLALKKARRYPMALSKIALSLRAALALPVSRVTVPGFDVFALAAETGLTAYDASYLWVARSRDAELVTLDAALARAASRDSRVTADGAREGVPDGNPDRPTD